MSLKVGVSKVDFTPRVGLPLLGNYRGHDYAARGVHDPLYSNAVVFQSSEGKKAALLSVHLCFVDKNNVQLMRDYISRKTGLKGKEILIHANHIHSGPSTVKIGSMPSIEDDNIIKSILEKVAWSVVDADSKLIDSTCAVGYSREKRVSFNRRLKCKDGKTRMIWEISDPEMVIEPWGPTDPELITVSITRDGKMNAALVNFATHPAILAGENWEYSADYLGYLAEGLARIYDDNFTTIFFNGCCGNVVPSDYSDITRGRGHGMCQRVGFMLASSAAEAIRKQENLPDNVNVDTSSEIVQLERIKITREQYEWSKKMLKRIKKQGLSKGQEDGLPDEHWAIIWKEMYEDKSTFKDAEVMAIRIGDIGIVGLPGEIFCELGMMIKKKSPAKHTIVIEGANDALMYFPTRESFHQGGYEVQPGSTFFAPGAGEKLVESALSQLKKLFS